MDSQLLLLSLIWLAYFILHSVLAALAPKHYVERRWPDFMPLYRLSYNLLATVLLIPPLWLTFSHDGEVIWQWQGFMAWLANGLALAAVVAFWWSLRFYDTQEFLGFRQWRSRETHVEDQEHLKISPLHRYVRHPWYTIALALLWTRDMDQAWLLSTVAMTAYFVIGSRMEERKLIAYHGEVYERYRERVPGLIPMPRKILSRSQAEQLLAQYQRP